MTVREFHTWGLYFDKYGPINPERMFDSGPAIISSQINKVHGKKHLPHEFLPYRKKEEVIVNLETEEQWLKALGGKIKDGQRR